MNLNNNPSEAELKELIKSIDDTEGLHVMWVDRSGEVNISLLVNETAARWAEKMDDKIQFRYETFGRGNGYLGESAAEDDGYISNTLKHLIKDWEEGSVGYIDV